MASFSDWLNRVQRVDDISRFRSENGSLIDSLIYGIRCTFMIVMDFVWGGFGNGEWGMVC